VCSCAGPSLSKALVAQLQQILCLPALILRGECTFSVCCAQLGGIFERGTRICAIYGNFAVDLDILAGVSLLQLRNT
jgi:hypothetical protein